MSGQHFRSLRRWALPLLACSLFVAGCGAGADDSGGLDPAIAEGNAAQIRKAYGAKVISGNVTRMPTRLMHQ